MDQKELEKKQLHELKNNYITTIYKGLVDKDSVREIHKKLIDETLNQKNKGMATSDNMLKVATNMVLKLKKKDTNKKFVDGYVKTTYGKIVEEASPVEVLGIYFFDLIKKLDTEKKMSHEIVRDADKREAEAKDRTIKENLEKNRTLENPKIFYLASWHKDSATDHAEWQGKIYVDEKWQSVIRDAELKDRVKNYITTNNIRTIQWVVGKPVWLITRPNCRHYFKILATDEVLSNSNAKLLKDYKMRTAIGKRQYLQTIDHARTKVWYDDVRNAELLVEKYKERLKLHQNMYAAKPNQVIRNAIIKDNALIYKWNKYIIEKKRGRI